MLSRKQRVKDVLEQGVFLSVEDIAGLSKVSVDGVRWAISTLKNQNYTFRPMDLAQIQGADGIKKWGLRSALEEKK